MSAEVTGVECGSCGQELPDARVDDPAEGRLPCPTCASVARLVKVHAHDEVSIRVDSGLKKRTPGFKSGGRSRPAQEQWSGAEKSADGVWRERQRVVDRENNRYVERVTDPDGTVIRDVDEPLDQHLHHGSDKPVST